MHVGWCDSLKRIVLHKIIQSQRIYYLRHKVYYWPFEFTSFGLLLLLLLLLCVIWSRNFGMQFCVYSRDALDFMIDESNRYYERCFYCFFKLFTETWDTQVDTRKKFNLCSIHLNFFARNSFCYLKYALWLGKLLTKLQN